MGWSCRADAGRVLDKMTQACVASTGMQNTYKVNDVSYFYEVSRTEHEDGAITGSIYRMLAGNMAQKAGSFRIEGDGTVTRAPKFLKDACK